MLNKIKRNRSQVICTILTVVMLCGVIVSMIGYVYEFAEAEGLEQLHMETLQIKSSLNLQMISDRENLQTMANFASKLYSDGEDFGLLFDSFKEIGLIKNIGILMPDNSFVTKLGVVDASEMLDFSKESGRGEYISGIVSDVTHKNHKVVRSGVPVVVQNEVVAMLYGMIELSSLNDRYKEEVSMLGAELYVMEGSNGDLVIDTKHEELGNITAMASLHYGKGYSFDKVNSDLSSGTSGFTVYKSRESREYIYAHYAPLKFGDWQIMLTLPESILYREARKTEKSLVLMFFAVVAIMVSYFLFIAALAHRKSRVSVYSSLIRKRLLELNRNTDNIWKALDNITEFAKSRSAFFLDNSGEDYSRIIPSQKQNLLQGEDLKYFSSKLMGYVSRQKKEVGVSVQVNKIITNKKLQKTNQEFCNFMLKHGIEKVYFAGVTDDSNNTILIGVANPRNADVEILLKDIAVCFSMAVYNKKHLIRTETMALTDSLTGLANRMAYKQDVKAIPEKNLKSLACIYIDVNELHYYNNNYGHAAGDQMLIYISEMLKDNFPQNGIYRMGGDEFLILAENIGAEVVEEKIKKANAAIEEMKYRISYGIKYWDGETEIEEIVATAEREMLIKKNEYYQEKEKLQLSKADNNYKVTTSETGIKPLDACLSAISDRYMGMYNVCLKKDTVTPLIATEYYSEIVAGAGVFSKAFKTYIRDFVKPEFQRYLRDFADYGVIEVQLRDGQCPRISYTKLTGEEVMLSVRLISAEDDKMETLWIFERIR